MREIIFRGKRQDNGEWVYGFPFAVNACFNIEGIETWDGERHLVDIKTVGQCTGIVDKHGVKVYEGDIVKTKYGRLCIVVWFASQVHNGWDLETVRTVENCVHTKPPELVDLYKRGNLEVVGNVYDNPEVR